VEVNDMKKTKRKTLEELVLENKRELLNNSEYMSQLEEKLDDRFRQK
jgi:hypothetical protein